MAWALRLAGLLLFGLVMVTLEVNAFPGPWTWTPWQVAFVLLAVVIVGLAVVRARRRS
jgi:hypothetical protein